MYTKKSMAAHIEHTLLRPDATPDQISLLCAEAKANLFAAVCVNPFYVPMCRMLTNGSDVKVCTVIGFPLGAVSRDTKVFEVERALSDGAGELDMVINIGALKAGDRRYVEAEIKEIRKVAGADVTLKIIIETSILSDDEKILACKICASAGADYIKTSTGFSSGGAKATDVSLIAKNSGGLLIKAAGGIKTLRDAKLMLDSGASRIGTSASIDIINEIRQ